MNKQQILNKIELVDPIPNLIRDYKEVVYEALQEGILTLQEWNMVFKFYRDEYGYSILHYIKGAMFKTNYFITENPIMIKNRKMLEERFGVPILNAKEYNRLI